MGYEWAGKGRSFGVKGACGAMTYASQRVLSYCSTRKCIVILGAFTLGQYSDVSETNMQPLLSWKLVHACRCLRCLASPHLDERLVLYSHIGKTLHYSQFNVRQGQSFLGRLTCICRSSRSRDLASSWAGQAWMTTLPWP